jgi:hypothetical protein
VSGQFNKEAALDRAKVRRFNVTRKMPADSYADLVEMAEGLRIPVERSGSPQN